MIAPRRHVVFDLDDFSEEIMTPELWDLLLELRRRLPNLKVTMFTVPLLCSKAWLRHVRKRHPWIEMHYHGSDHKDRDEWLARTEAPLPFRDDELFFPGFKAPWWRLDQQTADLLDAQGLALSVNKGFPVQARRVYRYDSLPKIRHGVCHGNKSRRLVHSHVQPQRLRDGLPDIFEEVAAYMSPHDHFLFVSEVL